MRGADMNRPSDTPFVPVVRSLLETDLYKFSMWQALLHWHPGAQTEYEFRCRNKTAYPLAELKDEVERQLDHLCTMSFAEEELDYLRTLRYIKSDFVDFLTVFRFQRKFITVETDGEHLAIRAVGPQVHVMGFEIFVLYIVNELYFRRFDQEAALAEGREVIGVFHSHPNGEPYPHPGRVKATDLSVDPTTGSDPSSVPVWLPGQDTSFDHVAAFWAPETCRDPGASCSDDNECASGECFDRSRCAAAAMCTMRGSWAAG